MSQDEADVKLTSSGLKVRITCGKRKVEDEIVNGTDEEKKAKKPKKHKKDKKEKKKKAKEESSEVETEDSEADTVTLPKKARMGGLSIQAAETYRDFTRILKLKPDPQTRPIAVCPDGHIFLETFSPIYKEAYDFLVAVAEPECRSFLVHEYQLTPYSLYAAVSVGLSTEDIITVLNRLSKVHICESIEKFIRECTHSYGKVKLVLQRNRYFVESTYPEILHKMLTDPVIKQARVKQGEGAGTDLIVSKGPTSVEISGGIKPAAGASILDPVLQNDNLEAKLALEDEEEEMVDSPQYDVHSFEINTDLVESVKKRSIELDYPMLEEYDFRNDTVNPNLPIDLKPTTRVRPYQEKSLSKMFGNGRARSGIIVLPCGAGKTLVGITSACTIKKSTLVLCISSVSVEQWRQQFKLWSTVEDKHIARFTSDQKEMFTSSAGITVTTYTMIAFGGQRSKEALRIMEELQKREWGLLILDEVHVVPANVFRKVLTVTQAHCKLGLTATLVREDDRISDLNFLIGPKLYEANWMDLSKAGHIANVQCVEVWCPMAPEFFHEHLIATSTARKMLLYIMNPNKFRNCQYLIKYHEERGDKIIVFSDNIWALNAYAKKLNRPFIYGPTSQTERMRVFSQFQHNPNVRTILISKVGDTAIDLPEANVIIQISSHYGSRRQEAQRLGRILRPKAKSHQEFNAFFYSLVSQDTQEMFYSTKRQQFLIDQGYSFKVISELPLEGDLMYSTKQEQRQLLAEVLAANEMEGREEQLPEDFDDVVTHRTAMRITSTGKNLTGGGDMIYSEVKKAGPSKGTAARPASVFAQAPQARHTLFKQRHQAKK